MLLAERDERPRKQGIENEIRKALEPLPGVRTKVGLGGSGEKYILVLSGEDPQALQAAALAVEKDLRTIGGLGQIASTASLVRPEIAVRPDFAKAADLGVTSAPSARRCALPPPATTTWRCPSSTCRSARCPSW